MSLGLNFEASPVHSVYLLLMVEDVSSQLPCCHDSEPYAQVRPRSVGYLTVFYHSSTERIKAMVYP